MSCEHDCFQPPPFPRALFNRPGLDAIDYCIGDYDSMRAHMLARIDAAPQLAAWTHRLPDDPGIALVEATAIVGDILARYQDLYANEAYLRTARWRDSIAELVRVLGYRLAPGLGGRARFALGIGGDRAVQVPAGFAVTARLPGAEKPATFETTHELDARPALSKFHLYRPRYVPSVANGMDTFQLDAGNTMELAKGDRLLVGIPDGRTLTHTQVLVVEKTWEAFGVRHVKTRNRLASLAGAIPGLFGTVTSAVATGTGAFAASALAGSTFATSVLGAAGLATASAPKPAGLANVLPASAVTTATSASKVIGLLGSGLGFLPAFSGVLNAGLALALLGSASALRAYKLAASSRHFGHNAPATRVSVDDQGRAKEIAVPYVRRLDATQGGAAAPQLRPQQLPLDGEVPEFSAGALVLVELNLSADESGSPARKRVLERGVSQVDRQSIGWGGMTGASTVLELDARLAVTEGATVLRFADIRGITVHAVAGEGLRLRATARPTDAAQGAELDYYGTRADAEALAQRQLLAVLPSGPAALQVQQVQLGGTDGGPRFFRLRVDRTLDLAAFPHEAPPVEVYGNLVEATEGKTEAEIPLGDGDARASFQTFALPKAPLTYLLDTTVSPPRLPELQVWVAGTRWQRVESFFGRGPRDCVYIVREAEDGRSFVQFGDGRTGARLPSGVANVLARYRTGQGAHGLAQDPPTAARRLPGVEEVWMQEPATGGGAAESASHAREAAPASMQSLGRIVSLSDCEAEALQLPGVLKARAAWTTLDGSALVAVTVLTASSDPAEAQALDLALRRALAARGPARWPLLVRIGRHRGVRIDLTIAADPDRHQAEIAEAVAMALGVADEDPTDDSDAGERGLMHWRQRQFGQDVHGSQVIGTAQNVPGVRWARLDRLALGPVGGRALLAASALQPLALRPAATALGSLAADRRTLRASSLELLTLARTDLRIGFVEESGGAAP